MVWRSWGEPLAWVFAVPALLGVAVFAAAAWASRTGTTEPFEFDEIEDSSGDVLGHVGSYLAVAIVDPKASADEAFLGLAVLGLILLIHVSVGLVHVNPLIYIFGYRTYTAITVRGNAYYLIVRSDVADWTGTQRLVSMTDSILIERPKS